MIAKRVAIFTYGVGAIVGCGTMLVVLGVLFSAVFGDDRFRRFCVDGMFLGLALSVLALGIRSIAALVWWFTERPEATHG